MQYKREIQEQFVAAVATKQLLVGNASDTVHCQAALCAELLSIGEIAQKEDLVLSMNTMGLSEAMMERILRRETDWIGSKALNKAVRSSTRAVYNSLAATVAPGQSVAPEDLVQLISDKIAKRDALRRQVGDLRSSVAHASNASTQLATQLVNMADDAINGPNETTLEVLDGQLAAGVTLHSAHVTKMKALDGAINLATYTSQKQQALRSIYDKLAGDAAELRVARDRLRRRLAGYDSLGPVFVKMAEQYSTAMSEMETLRALQD